MTWLSKNKFQAHLIVFSLMVLSSIGMVVTKNTGLTWGLLSIFAGANIVAMFIK